MNDRININSYKWASTAKSGVRCIAHPAHPCSTSPVIPATISYRGAVVESFLRAHLSVKVEAGSNFIHDHSHICLADIVKSNWCRQAISIELPVQKVLPVSRYC